MYISRLYFHNCPGKTLALEQWLKDLLKMAAKGRRKKLQDSAHAFCLSQRSRRDI